MTVREWYVRFAPVPDPIEAEIARFEAWVTDVEARDPADDDAAYILNRRGMSAAFEHYVTATRYAAWLAEELKDQLPLLV